MARLRIWAAFLVVAFFAGRLALGDATGGGAGQTYHAWAGFGIGSSATVESTFHTPQGAMTSSVQETLVEKADDHLVLEISSSMVMGGQTHTMPPTKMTIQASTADPSKDLTPSGTEDVTAAGKTFSCKIYDVSHVKGDRRRR